MATRVFKLLHQFRLQTKRYIQLVPEHLTSRRTCLYYLTSASNYSTSNSQSSTNKKFVDFGRNSSKDDAGVSTKPRHILLQEEGFIPIYKMELAPIFGAINKVKWQQLYLLAGCVPLSFLCASLSLCSTSVPLAVISVGGIVTSTLWIFSSIFRRLIGAILVSPDGETICISFIDSKGHRQDDIFPTTELVPLSELPYKRFTSSWWMLLQRYPTPEHEYESYKLFVQNYNIPDEQRFVQVFGSQL